jgi:cytidylate kinase
MRVVTLSASYGARGDKVGRALAERLQLPFVDRAIPTAAAARQLGLPEDVAESLDEHPPSRWQRIAARFANVGVPVGPVVLPTDIALTPEQFRSVTEAQLQHMADTTGAVVLGRAGMVVLGGRPDVLCVRLDGPAEARIAQVTAQGTDETSARQGQREVDSARETYARVFFNARQDNPQLYHVILDSTVLSAETCIDIIIRAAHDRFGTAGPHSDNTAGLPGSLLGHISPGDRPGGSHAQPAAEPHNDQAEQAEGHS